MRNAVGTHRRFQRHVRVVPGAIPVWVPIWCIALHRLNPGHNQDEHEKDGQTTRIPSSQAIARRSSFTLKSTSPIWLS
jgi:hypothetical protein